MKDKRNLELEALRSRVDDTGKAFSLLQAEITQGEFGKAGLERMSEWFTAFSKHTQAESDINRFYAANRDLDPSNLKYKVDLEDSSGNPTKLLSTWTAMDTWTRNEAVNLILRYHPSRPSKFFSKYEAILIALIERCEGVSIKAVDKNLEPEKRRYLPKEFVRFLFNKNKAVVPKAIAESFGLVSGSSHKELNDGLSNQASWRYEQREECKTAIEYALNTWPDECSGQNGTPNIENVGEAVIDHWEHISEKHKFNQKPFAPSGVSAIYSKMRRGESIHPK